MFKEISKKTRDTVVLFFVLLGTLVLLQAFLGRPVLQQARKLKLECKAKEAKLRESEALIKSVPDPQRAIEEIESKVEEFKKKGISIKESLRIIQTLGQSVSGYNIEVISIKAGEDLKKVNESLPPGTTKVYMEMVLRAPYKVLGEYIKSLGELPMGFLVESLSLEKKAMEKSRGKGEELLATLLLSTYSVWGL